MQYELHTCTASESRICPPTHTHLPIPFDQHLTSVFVVFNGHSISQSAHTYIYVSIYVCVSVCVSKVYIGVVEMKQKHIFIVQQ